MLVIVYASYRVIVQGFEFTGVSQVHGLKFAQGRRLLICTFLTFTATLPSCCCMHQLRSSGQSEVALACWAHSRRVLELVVHPIHQSAQIQVSHIPCLVGVEAT